MFCCTGNECPNVTVHWMTHYNACSAAVIGEMTRLAQEVKIPVCSPVTGYESNSLCFDGYAKTAFILFFLGQFSHTDTSNRSQLFFLFFFNKQIRSLAPNLRSCAIHVNDSKTFWPIRKWWLLESERQSAYSTLTNWLHVRYRGDNLYLLCNVHGVYCICKDKSNHVLHKDLLEDVWKKKYKKGRYPK